MHENVLVRRRYDGQGSGIHPSHQEDITGRPHALACSHHNSLRTKISPRHTQPQSKKGDRIKKILQVGFWDQAFSTGEGANEILSS
jgi:hypothetical protein